MLVVVGATVVVGALVVVVAGGRVVVVSTGTSVKITLGFVTVVAGAGTAVGAGAGARRVVGGTVGAGAAVVVVVSGTVRPVAGADPAAPRFPTNTVDGVNPSVVVVAWGREEITRDVLGEGSRFTAAKMMATKSAPTPSARKTF